MVKYKVNIKFKDTEKSLNEIITGVLKIELNKKFNITCNIKNEEVTCDYTHYSQKEGSRNQC
ncbi:MAG: hypothetical protein ACI4U0_00620 [Candidatus Aphodocola sp.]